MKALLSIKVPCEKVEQGVFNLEQLFYDINESQRMINEESSRHTVLIGDAGMVIQIEFSSQKKALEFQTVIRQKRGLTIERT